MKASLHLFLLLPLLSLTLSFPPLASSSHAPTSDLIRDFCKNTLYNDLCIASLQSHPDSHNTDLKGLAEIALKVAHANATKTLDYINKLIDNEKDGFMEQCLSDCSEEYLDAIDQIEDSFAALESKGYNDINTWVTAAINDAESCEEGFNDKPGHKSPLTSNNGDFTKLCSNSLAITKLLSG